MVTRIGHVTFRVPDLDAAVDFQRDVLGLVETERVDNVSYLTCNDRHHELVLVQDPVRRGYDHVVSCTAGVLTAVFDPRPWTRGTPVEVAIDSGRAKNAR